MLRHVIVNASPVERYWARNRATEYISLSTCLLCQQSLIWCRTPLLSDWKRSARHCVGLWEISVKRGDKVLLWQKRQSKFSTQFEIPLLHCGPQRTLSHSGKGWQDDDASCVICEALGSACTRDSLPICMAKEWLNTQLAETVSNEIPEQDSKPQKVRRVPTQLKDFVT